MSPARQLFLNQFSKDILIPDDEQLFVGQHGLEEITTRLAPEISYGIHGRIDFPIQDFLGVGQPFYDGAEIDFADNHPINITAFCLA